MGHGKVVTIGRWSVYGGPNEWGKAQLGLIKGGLYREVVLIWGGLYRQVSLYG